MVHQLFPSFVYQAPLKSRGGESINHDLLKETLKISEVDSQGQAWSLKNYPGGYTSYGSMSELHTFSSTFAELEKMIDQHVFKFVKTLELNVPKRAIKMRNCWVNIIPTKATHTMHIHPLSVISGTYYVKIPKGSSGLKFEDPRMTCFMASPPRRPKAKIQNQRFITIKPKVGEILLFESWMRHEVPPNPAPSERISISFNYDWAP